MLALYEIKANIKKEFSDIQIVKNQAWYLYRPSETDLRYDVLRNPPKQGKEKTLAVYITIFMAWMKL